MSRLPTSPPRLPVADPPELTAEPISIPDLDEGAIIADKITTTTVKTGGFFSMLSKDDRISASNIVADRIEGDAAALIEDILTSQDVYATSMCIARLPDGRFRVTVLRKKGDWPRATGVSIREAMEELKNGLS